MIDSFQHKSYLVIVKMPLKDYKIFKLKRACVNYVWARGANALLLNFLLNVYILIHTWFLEFILKVNSARAICHFLDDSTLTFTFAHVLCCYWKFRSLLFIISLWLFFFIRTSVVFVRIENKSKLKIKMVSRPFGLAYLLFIKYLRI